MATGIIKQPESYEDFAVTSVTVMNQSIPANEVTGNVSVTATKAGYYPIGIVGMNRTGTGSTYANIVTLYISAKSEGSATITANARNISTSSAISNLTLSAGILWMKIK